MWQKIKTILRDLKKSKTLQASFFLGLMGILEINLHLIRNNIGEENYGWVVIGVSVVMYYLRYITNQPLDSKMNPDANKSIDK